MTRSSARSDDAIAFERSYSAALAKYVKSSQDSGAGDRLGRRAVTLGVATLDLARIHERAVAANPTTTPSGGRADAFFAQALAPLEMAHCSARADAPATVAECTRLTGLLGRRTADLASARARLARVTVRGKEGQVALGTSERDNGVLLERSLLMEKRLRRMSHQLLTAQEDERKRISRDLHDAIGQTLTAINVGLAGLTSNVASDARGLAAAIALTQQLVERSMKTVHQFAWELRPPLLDDLGLVPALRSYAKTFAERTGLEVGFHADATRFPLDDDRATALFRLAQGALSNVERHAHAERVGVTLTSLPGMLRLEVTDDGRAFDVRRMATSKRNRHLGLLVMHERAEMVGGSLSIESSRGRGTTVRAAVPMEAPAGD